MRNYFLIGQVMAAKPVTRKDKATGVSQSSIEVTIQFLDFDKNGDLVLDVDIVSYDLKFLDEFKANVQKFVAIPYLYLNIPKGTYLFPDEMMTHHFYDTNPLIQKKEEIKKAS
ncbi:MAG: hypothetical protein RBR70_05355 [Arcobacter sp.]|jgi:hypothetical protein|uniref:hypothetical protein n=1 Tax=Arcobacter sp. TaxID=1872629 RepID=UPI002A75D32F|nr:hypothetical protein [Arcobacter sp.]MDY3204480.1 hypothetical protein [Arcobacter sp.]